MSATLDLAGLASGHRGLTPSHGGMLAECAAICLEASGHAQSVALSVRGHFRTTHLLRWPPPTEQMRRSWADMQEATEKGACGVAIALVLAKMNLVVVGRSVKGTGFDYWLGDSNAPPDDPFAESARIEISGILRGNEAQVDARSREKTEQLQTSNTTLPGFSVVVEFGAPQAKVVRR